MKALSVGMLVFWLTLGVLALFAGAGFTLVGIVRLDPQLFGIGLGLLFWAVFVGFSGAMALTLYDRILTYMAEDEDEDDLEPVVVNQ